MYAFIKLYDFFFFFFFFLIKQYANPSHIGISTRFNLYIIIWKKKKKKKNAKNFNKLPDLI